MKDNEKILQIIPADGWMAKYENKEEPDILEAVVCFALVESFENGEALRTVRPMSWVDTYVDFCDETSNFAGIVHKNTLTEPL